MRVYNGRLITIENGTFPCGYVDFEEGSITAFGPMETAPAYSGPVLAAKRPQFQIAYLTKTTAVFINRKRYK